MEKKLLLFALMVLIGAGSMFAQTKKNIFVIGKMGAAAKLVSVDDSLVIFKLKKAGWDVTFLSQEYTKSTADTSKAAVQAALDKANAVFVSSTVSSGNVAMSAEWMAAIAAGKPMMASEYGVWDEMKINGGNVTVIPKDTLATANSAVNAKFIGKLTDFNYITDKSSVTFRAPKASAAAGIVNIATYKATVSARDTVCGLAFYLKKGELNSDGAPSTADVIGWGFEAGGINKMTNAGWELFLRAVGVLVNQEPILITTGIDAFNKSNNPKMWYANGNLNIILANNMTGSFINIYSIEGKFVAKKALLGKGQIALPLNIKNGVYVVVGNGFTGKFVK